jgi:hypothetical protein
LEHLQETLDFLAIKYNWLVALTILTNISQWEGLSHILWKKENVPHHQTDKVYQ